MSTVKSIFQRKSFLATAIVLIAILAGTLGIGLQSASAAGTLPCDLYATGGTPCVAAHSTTRALFSAYSGRLYQVQRDSDNAFSDIGTLAAGGYANAAAQDSFCANTTCIITQIYDQTTRHNDLSIAPAGGAGLADRGTDASLLKVTAGGHTVYGMWGNPRTGYRDNSTSGVPTGSQSAGTYAVMSGTHFNNGCCFDYGNAETNNLDTGNGDMGAVYLGTLCWFSPCNGSGPWVMADLENGLFAGGNGSNSNNTSVPYTFVTAMVKNTSTTYAIKGGNATSGSLKTMYSGALPTQSGYTPLSMQGAIILGIGGDNSNSSIGSFYEGAMVAGQPSDATENAVQSNIISVGYTQVSTPTYNRIINQNSNKCVDVQQDNKANGANVDLYTCNGALWQNWRLVDLHNGYFKIESQNSGRVLDVTNCGTGDGVNVRQWDWLKNNCQQWQKVTTTAPWFRLVNRNSGKVLDVNGCGTGDTTNIQQWTWLNNACQQFKTQ
jgi:hypothetical protein